MIGWKCNAGVYTYTNTSDIYTDLTQFEFLDIGVPFLFTTEGTVEDAPIPSGKDVYELLSSYIGSDVDLLFSVPIPSYNENEDPNTFDKYRSILPSAYLGFVNTSNRIRELRRGGSKKNGPVFYFPQLNRVFVCSRGNSIGAVYSVEGTKLTPIVTRLNDSDIGIHWCVISQYRLSLEMWHYKGGISQEDLIDYHNYTDYTIETDNGLYGVRPVSQGSQIDAVINALFANNYVPPDWDNTPSNPYEPGGSSGTGGGGGSFDNTSTPIDIPNLPSISAASTGFISLFNPTLNQLNELASYLWSDLFDVNGWKKLFADPMDAILGLSIVPVAVPSGGTREVKVGNIGTGISLTVASSQFVEVDCGSIDVNEYWGAYLDYEPYTQAQIFLPYIGTRPISVDEIMGKTVRVVYHVDILTGACCCFVKCGDSVLYTYNGQCSIPIPITGANYASVVNGVISVAASVGSLVATGGSSAPTAIPAIASSAVNQMKPQVEKSGSISGSAGVLNMQTPYLILIRPRQALPSKQNEFIGYPSLITVQLTELSGYTEIQSIHLENIPATQEELAEIESLLKGGVIF